MALAYSTWEDGPRLSGSTVLDRPAMPEEGPGVRVSPFSSHRGTQQDVKQLEPENKLLLGAWQPAVLKTMSLWSFHNGLVFTKNKVEEEPEQLARVLPLAGEKSIFYGF